jgi:hypothetical protein
MIDRVPSANWLRQQKHQKRVRAEQAPKPFVIISIYILLYYDGSADGRSMTCPLMMG